MTSKTGKEITYETDGSLDTEGTWLNGMKHGTFIQYLGEDGKIWWTEYYEYGKKEGEWKEYSKGVVFKITTYKNNKKITEAYPGEEP